jgi:hypothetical protein
LLFIHPVTPDKIVSRDMMKTFSDLYLLRITDELNEFYLLPYKDNEACPSFKKWSKFEQQNRKIFTGFGIISKPRGEF